MICCSSRIIHLHCVNMVGLIDKWNKALSAMRT